MTYKIPAATHITSDDALQRLVAALKHESLIAVDTESNAMYAYRGQICLIQLSTRTQDYIIDPFTIEDMQPFGDILADERIEKVFHSAEYDIILIARDWGLTVRNLFDTMYAARLCHYKRFGLADLLEHYFGIEVDKTHQRDDWGARPLPSDSLRYAQMDTHYLPDLRDKLHDKLETLNRLDEAQEVFEDVLRIEAKSSEFDPDGFWKIGLPRSLSRKQLARLREIYLVRERIAQDEDVPPFKVVSDKELALIAKRFPRNFTEFSKIKGVSSAFIRIHGDEFLEALERGRNKKLPPRPHHNAPPPHVVERYTALQQWRKACAKSRDLHSSLIVSKQTLWTIAEEMPKNKSELAQIDGIGDWRLDHYGEELLDVVTSFHVR